MASSGSGDWDAKLSAVERFVDAFNAGGVDRVARLDVFARRVEARDFARSQVTVR